MCACACACVRACVRVCMCLVIVINILIFILFLICRCVLGNTTIVAEFASDDDINRFFAQASAATSWPPTSSLPPSAGPARQNSSGNRLSSRQGPSTPGGGVFASRWGGQESISPWSSAESSVNQAPLTQSPPSAAWGDGGTVDRARTRLAQSPPPLNSFLPGDLLGGEAM